MLAEESAAVLIFFIHLKLMRNIYRKERDAAGSKGLPTNVYTSLSRLDADGVTAGGVFGAVVSAD